MGQRLVVTIHNEDKELCKIYYHWSAYSFSALLRTQELVNCIYNHKEETENELLLRLIRFLEANGGGIDGNEEEQKYIQSLYPNETFKKDGYSRNDGLIAISEKGKQDMQTWSEGDIDIYLDEDLIHNSVFWDYDSIDEYNEYCAENDEDYEPKKLEDIKEIGYSLSEIDIADLDNLIHEMRNVDWVCRYGNEIYDLIE